MKMMDKFINTRMHFILHKKHFRITQCVLFLIGFGLQLLYANNQIITGDQQQILYKGYLGAYQNVWLPYGNAASAMGNVPGLLSGYLVGIPLLIWDNPWAPMLLIIALRAISFLLFDNVIKRIFDTPTRLFFAVLYWLNPWLLYDSLLYNPAYLCFFTALHFWSAFKLKDKTSFYYTLLHVLAIGGAMQVHYSWPLLAIISCFLLYRKMTHPSWIAVITGFAILIVSLIPYFQEYLSNESISRTSDRYLGYGLVHIYPIFKALLYWLRYSSTMFSNRIITDANFDWLEQINWLKMLIEYIWQVLLFILGTITLVLSTQINWHYAKVVRAKLKPSEPIVNDKEWLLLFVAGTLIAVVVGAMLSPITFSYWHLILIFPLALIPILLKLDEWHSISFNKASQLFILLATLFITINLIAANGSGKYSYKVNYSKQVNEYLLEQGLIKTSY